MSIIRDQIENNRSTIVDTVTVDSEVNTATTSYVNSKPTGMKNLLINGGFDIWQRGTTTSSGVVVNNAYGYGADRFWGQSYLGYGVTGSVAVIQTLILENTDTVINANKISLQCDTQLGAGGIKRIFQRIEDVRRVNGVHTLSFNIKSTGLTAVHVLGVQHFGTGGSSSVEVDLGEIAISTTYSKQEITFTPPSFSGKTFGADSNFEVIFLVAKIDDSTYTIPAGSYGNTAASNDDITLANIQLEEGSVATPFEQRPYGLELSLCQRYYRTGNIYAGAYSSVASNVRALNLQFNEMRYATTVNFLNLTFSNASALIIDWVGVNYIGAYLTLIGAGNAWANGTYTADAEF